MGICAIAFDWEGLLIDADNYNVRIARTILPKRVDVREAFITRDNLQSIRDWVGDDGLGVLSIDVDGNDYWFLQDLIDLKPAIIASEYNSTFGRRSITIPYNEDFSIDSYHYGASLSALSKLTRSHGYSLVGQVAGVNAFFVRDDLLLPTDQVLDPDAAYQSRQEQQWDGIKDRPFVEI